MDIYATKHREFYEDIMTSTRGPLISSRFWHDFIILVMKKPKSIYMSHD